MSHSTDELKTISRIDEPTINADKPHKGFHLNTLSMIFAAIAVLATLALFFTNRQVNDGFKRIQAANDRVFQAEDTANDLSAVSDDLTTFVRCYVVTGDRQYMNAFLTEVYETKRRDQAVDTLAEMVGQNNHEAYRNLARARELSDNLVQTELLAMRLVLETGNVSSEDYPSPLRDLDSYTPELELLSAEEKQAKAIDLVFGPAYMSSKGDIQESTALCHNALREEASSGLESVGFRLRRLLLTQSVLSAIMLAVVLTMIVYILVQIRRPLTRMVRMMKDNKVIPPTGAEELRFMTLAYNKMVEENRKTTEQLTYEAMHDRLTGLLNRNAFEVFYRDTDIEHAALLIVDVDDFKSINDTYGHDGGDRILKRVAEILRHSFRSVDQVYRFGGDEFVVIMTRASSSMRDLVLDKINQANHLLLQGKGDIPPGSLSAGVAFCDRENPQGDLLKDADTALYRVKEAGRCGCAVY